MSAATYLGSFPVVLAESQFKDYGPTDWAMYFVESYGQIGGDHHKAWVLDQIARILKGAPVTVEQRRWTDHEPEFDVRVGEPTQAYLDWVEEMKGPWDPDTEEHEYWYEDGTPP